MKLIIFDKFPEYKYVKVETPMWKKLFITIFIVVYVFALTLLILYTDSQAKKISGYTSDEYIFNVENENGELSITVFNKKYIINDKKSKK